MGRTVCGAAPGARRRFTPRSLPVASLAVPLLSLLITRPAGAQLPSGAGVSPGAEQLQRQNRIDELRRIELDQRLRANQAVPPGQRILVDYGGYISSSVR
jgi:hypothetical protein